MLAVLAVPNAPRQQGEEVEALWALKVVDTPGKEKQRRSLKLEEDTQYCVPLYPGPGQVEGELAADRHALDLFG